MTAPLPLDILLVEDDPNDMEMITRALKKNNLANRLLTIDNGADALDFLFGRGTFGGHNQGNRPKVILLDIKLPKVDGLEVLRQIKLDERTKTLPVVMVTSSREDSDLQKAYAYGANSYVVKPVNSSEFSDAIVKVGFYWLQVNESLFLRAGAITRIT
jgi:two-component system, response regulator